MTETTAPQTAAATAELAQAARHRSLWLDAFRRLRRNRGAMVGGLVFIAVILVAIFAQALAPHDPNKLNPIDSLLKPGEESLLTPGSKFLLGADNFGRDVLSRIIHGTRTSIAMGLVAVTISVTLGSILGLLSGYYRGAVDMVVMRLADLMLAFPGILLALVIIAILGTNLQSAMIAVGISAMPVYIRVVRGSVLSAREREYVEAARVIGSRDLRIVAGHIFPNVLAPIIVLATLGIPNAIIAGASLSFLGLGIKPPTPDWGSMLSNGRDFISTSWWLPTFPGLAIVVTVISINLLGDGIRDALDPRLKI